MTWGGKRGFNMGPCPNWSSLFEGVLPSQVVCKLYKPQRYLEKVSFKQLLRAWQGIVMLPCTQHTHTQSKQWANAQSEQWHLVSTQTCREHTQTDTWWKHMHAKHTLVEKTHMYKTGTEHIQRLKVQTCKLYPDAYHTQIKREPACMLWSMDSTTLDSTVLGINHPGFYNLMVINPWIQRRLDSTIVNATILWFNNLELNNPWHPETRHLTCD